MARRRLALVFLGVIGCAATKQGLVVVDGVHAWFPAEATVVDAREPRRADARIAHALDEDGARFEIARFVTDEPMSAAEARVLVLKTLRALTALPGAEAHEITGDDPLDVTLTVHFQSGEKGRWRLKFAGDRTFFQLSVVGDDAPEIWERAERFFASARFTP